MAACLQGWIRIYAITSWRLLLILPTLSLLSVWTFLLMDDTSACFSGFLGPEMLDDIINYAEQRLACDTSGQHSRNLNTGTLASDDRTNESDIPSTSHTAFWKSIVGTAMEVRFSPPQILSCANVEASKYKTCSKPGTMACGECRLVSYCSKVRWIGFLTSLVLSEGKYVPRNVRENTGKNTKQVKIDLSYPH